MLSGSEAGVPEAARVILVTRQIRCVDGHSKSWMNAVASPSRGPESSARVNHKGANACLALRRQDQSVSQHQHPRPAGGPYQTNCLLPNCFASGVPRFLYL